MNPTLLLVEDDPFTVELVRRALDRAGVAVDVVVEQSGEAALERLHGMARAGAAPDAVLLDMRPRGAGGLDLLADVRAVPGMAGRPVVVYTGTASGEEEAQARAAGAADFFVKPDGFDALVERMRGVGAWLTAPA